jgi:hypothetical protein
MFLEIYAIPMNDYSEETEVAKKPVNKRLIEMTGARIRYSAKFQDRAEVVLPSKEILLAVGSYDDLVARLEAAKGAQIARI